MQISHDPSSKTAYWHQMIENCSNSGLSINAFCRKKQISQASFYNWKKKLSKQPIFVQLPITKILNARKDSANIILNYKDFRIELTENFSGNILSELLNILKDI
jgi:hypothetical protein